MYLVNILHPYFIATKKQPFLSVPSTTDNVVTKRKSAKLVERLGKNIAARRKEFGFTQDRLAEAVGVDTETISRFERGVTAPSLATLEIIAKQLEVTMAALLEEPRPEPSDDALVLSARLGTLKGKERVFLMDFIDWYCRRSG